MSNGKYPVEFFGGPYDGHRETLPSVADLEGREPPEHPGRIAFARHADADPSWRLVGTYRRSVGPTKGGTWGMHWLPAGPPAAPG